MKFKIFATALVLSIASILILPHAVSGQSYNWTSVKAIPKGMDVIVERKRDDKVVGILQAVTDDSIAITSDEGSFVIGMDNVAKIFHAIPRNKKKVMNRAALYGMLIGLGAGVAVSAAYPPEREEQPGVGIFFGGLGVGIWAGSRHAKGRDKGPILYSAK